VITPTTREKEIPPGSEYGRKNPCGRVAQAGKKMPSRGGKQRTSEITLARSDVRPAKRNYLFTIGVSRPVCAVRPDASFLLASVGAVEGSADALQTRFAEAALPDGSDPDDCLVALRPDGHFASAGDWARTDLPADDPSPDEH
jgi:hypothetical protein